MPISRRMALFGAALAFAVLGAALPVVAAPGVERLTYQVVYRGVFSLGRNLPIADLTLETDSATIPGGLRIGLLASSAAYGLVESTYPLRYRFRSWAHAESGHLAGFETYEKTRNEKHRLYVRDASERGVRRMRPGTRRAAAELNRLETGIQADKDPVESLFDRLGLLQRVRSLPLEAGAQFDFPVTNGKTRMHYRVRVEAATVLRNGGVDLPAWKLRFDGERRDRRGQTSAAHRSVYIWLSRDQARIPLRADVRHAIGLFRVQLAEVPARQQIAVRTP